MKHIHCSQGLTIEQGKHKFMAKWKIPILIFIQCNEHYIKGMGKTLWKQEKVAMNSAEWGRSLFWFHMDIHIEAGL